MSNLSAQKALKGLEGMIVLRNRKIGVLTNNHQFIPYSSFNKDFADEIDKFCEEYNQDPGSYKLGAFNFDSYSHLEEIDWENSNLILASHVFKKLKILDDSLPDEIKKLEKHPMEKCMSSYMGMRKLAIFGSKIGYYPILVIVNNNPIVINFNTATSNSEFEKEVEHLIISSPLFTNCRSEEFKNGVLDYDFDDNKIDELSNHTR
jgi:hypothetical protein